MKTKLLLFLFGLLLAVGCSTTDTVSQADQKWADHARLQTPKLFDVARVNRERHIYEKVSKSGAPAWRKRRAELNYIVAVNESMIPDIPQPPGRGSAQPNPFQ